MRANQGSSSFTWGLRLSVWCGEETPFENPARSNAQVSARLGLAGIDERTASTAMCRAWGVSPAPAIENQVVTSDVPVLVLSGEFDPDTPPSWGRGMLAHLSHGRFVSMPGLRHGAGFNRCGARVEVAFLKDPQAPLDLGCVVAMSGADFAASALSRIRRIFPGGAVTSISVVHSAIDKRRGVTWRYLAQPLSARRSDRQMLWTSHA